MVLSGADAIGFNFYPQSKRYIARDSALELIANIPDSVAKIGVYVNASVADMITNFDKLGLTLSQLHGDESPEFILQLDGRPVIKAFRFGPEGWDPIERYLSECNRLGIALQGVLIDSFLTGSYGGTGHKADWTALAGWQSRIDVPLILAGGLTAANVTQAIQIVRSNGVDTASGVELKPGQKDAGLVREFVSAAHAAMEAMNPPSTQSLPHDPRSPPP